MKTLLLAILFIPFLGCNYFEESRKVDKYIEQQQAKQAANKRFMDSLDRKIDSNLAAIKKNQVKIDHNGIIIDSMTYYIRMCLYYRSEGNYRLAEKNRLMALKCSKNYWK